MGNYKKGINDLWSHDLVVKPKILIGALKACRRVNDFGLDVRLLEAVRDKCGNEVSKVVVRKL